jgi:hypothetical protein
MMLAQFPAAPAGKTFDRETLSLGDSGLTLGQVRSNSPNKLDSKDRLTVLSIQDIRFEIQFNHVAEMTTFCSCTLSRILFLSGHEVVSVDDVRKSAITS